MSVPCLMVILCIQIIAGRQSWIFEKEFPANASFKKIAAIDNQILIAQTDKDIYVAPFHNPNSIKQTVVSNIPQHIDVVGGNKGSSFLYVLNNYIQYKQADSMWHSQLKQMEYPRSFIKIKDLLYFCSPKLSPYLLIFNTTSAQISKGPYLISRQENQLSLALEVSPALNHLIAIVDSSVFFIDLKTMTIINTFTCGLYAQKIEVMVSPKGKYVTHNNMEFKEIFMYDQKAKNYSLIYRFVQDGNDYHRYGFTFNEEQSFCYEIMMNKEDNLILRHIVEMDCSEPYDQIVDKLGDYDYMIRYLDRRNRDFLYSFGQVGAKIIYNRHYIMEEQFIWIEQIQLPFDKTIKVAQILQISDSKEKMVLYDQQSQLIIWDFQRSSRRCQNQINQQLLLKNKARLAVFDIFQKQLFLLLEMQEKVMVWIDLDTCEIRSQNYGVNILTIYFVKNRTYLSVLTNNIELFLLDQLSKQMEQRFILHTFPNIAFGDSFYGISQNSHKVFLQKYDESWTVVMNVQLNCQTLSIRIKAGSNHLSVICGNQYNVYGSNLQYLGSSQINIQSFSSLNNIEETFNPFLRVDLKLGELHSNVLKRWRFSVETQGYMITPDSNFYFYNQTDMISLGKDKQRYYLSHFSFVNNQLTVILRVSIDLKTSQGYTIIPNLRWSCDKRYILVKYIAIKDNSNIYINVYETFTFRLVYSHRLDLSVAYNGLPTDSFNAYLDCDNLLTISTFGKVYYINLNKSSTILLESQSDISSISLSSDSKNAVLYGQNHMKSYVLEVRSVSTSKIIKNKMNVDYEGGIKTFFTESLFVLNKNILYSVDQDGSKVIRQQIADCDYNGQTSLICLTLNNSIALVNSTETRLVSLEITDKSYNNILSKGDILILHNTYQFAFHLPLEPFTLLQTIKLEKSRFDSISVSPDSKKMIAYDSLQKNFVYWRKGSCPDLSELQNGRCVCVEEESQGVCACRERRFASQGECLDCSFYCKQCINSAGNCESLSTTGILMIITITIIFVFAVIAACYCLKKRREKKVKVEAMSTLLEQINTSNDQ